MPRTLLSTPPAVASFWEKNKENLPVSFPYELRKNDVFCGSDPESKRLGSGGGTVFLLFNAWKATRENDETLETWLKKESRVMIHAGGESRRLPAYASAGKAFLPLPLKKELPFSRFQQTLIDLILPRYYEVLEESGEKAALLLASGDVWLDFDTSLIPKMTADFVGVGMKVSPQKAKNHGVFFPNQNTGRSIDGEAQNFKEFRQKPNVELIYELAGTGNFYVDTGLWLFSVPGILALFESCGWNSRSQVFETPDGFPKNLDFYGETACALGETPAISLPEVKNLSAQVIPLESATFLHLGTSRQVFDSLESMQETNWHSAKSFYRAFTAERVESQPNRDMPVWVDAVMCHLPQFGGNNVLANIPQAASLQKLGRGNCLICEPILNSNEKLCFRAFDLDDTFRGEIENPHSQICGFSAPAWLYLRGINLPAKTDIFDAEIFPILENSEISQKWIDWFFSPTPDSAVSLEWTKKQKLSARQISAQFDARRYFETKVNGMQKALESWVQRISSVYQASFWLYDFAELASLIKSTFPEIKEEIFANKSAIRSHLKGTLEAARFEAFLAELSGELSIESTLKSAFQLLRDAVIKAQKIEASQPISAIKSDQIVWGRSPIRLDLAGGWSDAPPFCFEHGGKVLNLAVNLNGQPPIQVFVRKRPELGLKLHSIDLGINEEILTFEELDTFRNPESGFSLPKCALALAGFHPNFCSHKYPTLKDQLEQFGGGLEISLLAAVPKGSGLGTSSILGATLLASISRASSLSWDKMEIFRRVLAMEQLLTTGGGWQDQAGALFAGIKLICTDPGFCQFPKVRYLSESLIHKFENKSTLLLYYTGITRLAKNVLQQIVANMLLRKGETIASLYRLSNNGLTLFDALQRQDLDMLATSINRSWALNKSLDSGTCPKSVQDILDICEPDMKAAKLLGAGGGGFLLILAKDAQSALRLRQRLESNPPNDRARFIEPSLASEGLLVTVS